MNSRIIKKGQKNLRRSLANLSVCLIASLALASCSSSNVREIAQEKANDDIVKIHESNQARHQFHSKKFERHNEH